MHILKKNIDIVIYVLMLIALLIYAITPSNLFESSTTNKPLITDKFKPKPSETISSTKKTDLKQTELLAKQ